MRTLDRQSKCDDEARRTISGFSYGNTWRENGEGPGANRVHVLLFLYFHNLRTGIMEPEDKRMRRNDGRAVESLRVV